MNAKHICGLFVCCFLARAALAQVEVLVMLDQDQFLPGERLPVKVRVINHSGQTLVFGQDDSWLQVSIAGENSFVVPCKGDVPVAGEFELPPSKMATKELDLAPYFELSRPGRYTLAATVTIKEWNQTLNAPPEPFDVISGTKLWERSFGIPDPGRSGPPTVRKYLLQQANYVGKQLRLYVRITDATESETWRVIPIGPMVSFSNPQAQVDAESRLHLLFQSGPKSSTYCVIDPEGELLKREMFEYGTTRPRLTAAEDGGITVKGGLRFPASAALQPPAAPREE